ncbi:outer membrane protein assembly factor BamB family protein [Natronorubrum sp. FCH18a]|uniref:outer membrane protein assembly factor BamB family protein n=1 Tax=Natronorubrum sp. FCH18a TaxID=3447018 RepID=UPI003F516CC1
MRRRLLAVCGTVPLTGCSALGRDDGSTAVPLGETDPSAWTTYRGDVAQTGSADTTLESPYELETLWSFSGSISMPSSSRPYPEPGIVVTEAAVYATAADMHTSPSALDRTTGDVLWRFDDVIDDVHDAEFYRTPVPIAIGDDIFVSTSGRLARIDGPSGELVWDVGQGVPRESPRTGTDSELYNGDSVGRLDPENGEELDSHRFRLDGVFEGLAVGDSAAVVVVRTNEGHSGQLAGYDTSDWSLEWETDVADPIWQAPTIHDGTAVALTDSSRESIRCVGGETIAFDATEGAELWRAETPDARIGPAVDEDGTVYLPHEEAGLIALEGDDGSRRWTGTSEELLESLTGDPDAWYPPIVTDDAVVLSGRGGIAIFDREDGSLRDQFDRRLQGMPGVAYGAVYAITDEGILAIRGTG